MEEDIKQEMNPWQVTSKHDFLFYCCPECDIKAKDYKVFYDHAITSHPKSKISLDKLDKEHVKENGQNDNNIKFEIQFDEEEHNETHINDISDTIDICNKIDTSNTIDTSDTIDTLDTNGTIDFNDIKGLKQQSNGVKKLSQNVNCDKCYKTFKSVVTLKKHMKEIHQGQKKSSKARKCVCHICGKDFCYPSDLKIHEAIHNKHNSSKDFICDKCGKGFPSKENLTVHIYHHHRQKFFICTFCERIFTKKNKTLEHLVKDHLVNATKDIYYCDQCHTSFSSSCSLNSHMVSQHAMSCDFQCSECDKTFVTKTVLTSHMMEDHSFDPLKKGSVTVTSMKVIEDESVTRSFKCDICGEYLKSEQTLAGHIMGKHRKECHNIKCDLCPFKTYRDSILKSHMKQRHSDQKPTRSYACTECDNKKFTDKRYLKKHLLDKHGILYKTD